MLDGQTALLPYQHYIVAAVVVLWPDEVDDDGNITSRFMLPDGVTAWFYDYLEMYFDSFAKSLLAKERQFFTAGMTYDTVIQQLVHTRSALRPWRVW